MTARKILILGATSAIAQAYARRRAGHHCSFILAARREDRLCAIAADLIACGAAAAEIFVVDPASMSGVGEAALELRERFGEPDEVVVTYGMLGDQCAAERDLVLARTLIDTNFASAALWILALLAGRQATMPFTVVGIGSVAGDRGRASNCIYGAAKGGLDRFLEGLAQKFDGTATRIIRVKPGFVDTPMTDHIKKGGLLWTTPDRVAADIEKAVAKGRRLAYTPWFWWPIMLVIRNLPWFIFRRLKV